MWASHLINNYRVVNIDMFISVLTVCKNEEEIMPFFMKHYLPWVDEIVIADGHSTDRTVEIAKRLGGNKVTIKMVDDGDKLHEPTLMNIRNTLWQGNEDKVDWQIVADADEFLYCPNIREKLQGYMDAGITFPKIRGFDMVSTTFPSPNLPLTEQFNQGIWMPVFLDKRMIFSPKFVSPNYAIGCHQCNPTGVVVESPDDELKMLHYKWLGLDYLLRRANYARDRNSQENIEKGWAAHYNLYVQTTEEKFYKTYMFATPAFKIDRSYLKEQYPFVYDEQFEWNVYQVFDEEIKGKNVLDIGGHFGFFTIKAHDMGAKRIVAVEANPFNYVKYLKNTKDLTNLRSINAACMPKTGEMVTINNDSGGSTVGLPGTTVTTVCLADVISWFPDNEDIVMKVDVEGSEFPIILESAPELIRRCNIVVLEIHGPQHTHKPEYTVERLVNHMLYLGYAVTWVGNYYTNWDGTKPMGNVMDLFIYKFVRL
jgi:FkbM family methyltransferase